MYVMDGEEIPFLVKKPVSVYDNAELRDYMLCAFGKILDVKDETDPKAFKHYQKNYGFAKEIRAK